MKLHTKALAAVVLAGCLLFPATETYAQKGGPRSTNALRQQIIERLESLEERHPGDQATIFQLRVDVEELYQHVMPDLTDPVTFRGPEVPDLSLGTRPYDGSENLSDSALRQFLVKLISNHHPIGYQEAQDAVFSDVDNHNGQVECVYTGRKLACSGEPPATNMNLEHTWPQSQGATGIAKADLHHLFPTDSKANGIRGNLPFGKVSQPNWQEGGSMCDRSRFEVRPEQRGDTARAKFYFAVRYNKSIGPNEEAVLREWNREDPPDEKEQKRNDRIQNIQSNRNPFIDHPEFIDRISDF